MDRQIERKRLMAEHYARVEKYKIEIAEYLASEKCQRQSHPKSDYRPNIGTGCAPSYMQCGQEDRKRLFDDAEDYVGL